MCSNGKQAQNEWVVFWGIGVGLVSGKGAYKIALIKSYDGIDQAFLWKFVFWYVSYLVFKIHCSDVHENGNAFFFFQIFGSIHLH